MQIAYISGKYRSKTPHVMRVNIIRAEAIAMKYWKLGCSVICPHKNTAFMDNSDVSDAHFLKADLELIERCVDVIIMVPGWEDSEGAILEHKTAIDRGIEVIYETEETINKYLSSHPCGSVTMLQDSNLDNERIVFEAVKLLLDEEKK